MIFANKLKKELKEKKSKIQIKSPLSSISGANWVDLSITSLDGSPLSLGTPINNIKFRFQPLLSGAKLISCPYRLDNHTNKPLHQHFENSEFIVNCPTLSGALLHILGSEYELLER